MAVEIKWVKGPKDGSVVVEQFLSNKTTAGKEAAIAAAETARQICDLCRKCRDVKTHRFSILSDTAINVATIGNNAGEPNCDLIGKKLVV